jgi:class 3 adenylate cyclase/HAMP domain-containing protein
MRCNLRYKIFFLMGGLVLGLLLATLVVVGLQARRVAKQRIVTDLQGTRQQFEELQRLRYQSLLALSRVLGREYALRNAVATYDPPTIFSAMQSFQSRIRSDFFLITDDQGVLLAATSETEHPGADLSMHPTIQGALEGEEALHIWHLQGRLYQVATVPLNIGPDILGTLSLGYEIDQAFLHELKTITGSEITVLADHTILASTWPAMAQRELMEALAGSGWATASPSPQAGHDMQTLSLGGETYLSLAVPLVGLHRQPVGVYILQQSLDQALAMLRSLQRTLLLAGVVAVVLALLLSFIIARGVTAPVQQLVQGAQAVGRGDYQYRVTVHTRDELAVLAQAYNTMTEKLQENISALNAAYRDLQQQAQALEASLRKVELLEQVKIHLGKFVPESVKRLIETAPEAPALDKRDHDVSVLFLDIAGYTRLSAHNSREKMNALVERYFSSFLDAIYAHNGDINETAGDGLMILFQDDDPVHNATNAVRTALAIQQQVSTMNRTGRDMDPITVNIGINSGIAAVGSTRFEGLAGERWTYTASGPVTNIAARLAELATHGDTYLGEETATRVKNNFSLQFLGERQAKNVQEPILVYQVRSAEGPSSS